MDVIDDNFKLNKDSLKQNQQAIDLSQSLYSKILESVKFLNDDALNLNESKKKSELLARVP